MRETELFTSGAEGYHTFRIPSLATTKDGAILAHREGMKHDYHDHEALDLVRKTSTANSPSWKDPHRLHGNGENTFHAPPDDDGVTATPWLSFNRDANGYT